MYRLQIARDRSVVIERVIRVGASDDDEDFIIMLGNITEPYFDYEKCRRAFIEENT